jgi:hypothetical protein
MLYRGLVCICCAADNAQGVVHNGFIPGLCGLVVRVPGCRSRGPGSIPGATRFSEK